MDLASAAMKTRACLGAVLLGGSLLALGGCGVGEYHIPAVAPVVKQPPDKSNSLLDDEPAAEEKKPEEKSEAPATEEKK
jgi:hypothetical protein